MDIKTKITISLIKRAAVEVHNHLKGRYLESLYRNALLIELRNAGLKVEVEKNVKAYYKDEVIGSFRLDLLVNDCVVVELKAVNETMIVHEIQLVNYLQTTGYDFGLLINFGGKRLFISEKTRFYHPN